MWLRDLFFPADGLGSNPDRDIISIFYFLYFFELDIVKVMHILSFFFCV